MNNFMAFVVSHACCVAVQAVVSEEVRYEKAKKAKAAGQEGAKVRVASAWLLRGFGLVPGLYAWLLLRAATNWM
jgi:hypothetical protein